MTTVLLFIVLFMVACWIGYIITGAKKVKPSCQESGDSFIITYNDRIIIVTGNRSNRLCSYKWKGKVETLIIPIGKGADSIKQVEHFVARYKTSKLVRYLFDFSSMKEPILLIYFDPDNGKELSEIQMKLKCFIRNK